MPGGCDGCQQFVTGEVKTINAKEWNPILCSFPVLVSHICEHWGCKYSIGKGCIEYQFCPECLANEEIVRKTFEEGMSFF